MGWREGQVCVRGFAKGKLAREERQQDGERALRVAWRGEG